MIFPLKQELSKGAVESLAKLPIVDFVTQIKPYVQYYYHLRHQNSSGELCLLEKDSFETGSVFFGVDTILERIRQWCVGHITNQYPPDSEEVDFCSHFNFIHKEIKFFYPQQFLDQNLIEGDCYAGLFSYLKLTNYSVRTFFGVLMDGITKRGIIEKVSKDVRRFLHHEGLITAEDLYTHPSIVKELIAENRLLKAHWFHIEKEPLPFESFKDLVAIIGNGNYEAGIARMSARPLDFVTELADSFVLGIRFPNRKNVYEFQLFKVFKAANPAGILLGADKVLSIIQRYERVEAIECEKLTEATFHQRNSKRADHAVLKEKHLNFFGVGALGSEMADSMGKAGIGKIKLYDNQILKGHNPIRHLSGFEHVGQLKILAVLRSLHFHNPFVEIDAQALNLYELEITPEHIQNHSITISSVADDDLEGYINQQLVIANLPAFYVRALRGGKVARIFRVIPGRDACFHCLNLYKTEQKAFIEVPEDPDYPTLKNECNNPIRPASAADLKLIAGLASQLIIQQLQGGYSENNHWIWSSEILPSTPLSSAYCMHQQKLPPHPDCYFCNHGKQNAISIPQKEAHFMQELVRQNPEIETGGVLAGYREDNGDIRITNASGPGPNASRTAAKFEKDIKYCQAFLDDLYVQSKHKIMYVGEWHSHPSPDNTPSITDIKSLSEIALQKEYLTECPAMIILSNSGIPSCTIHPAGKRYYYSSLAVT